MNKSTKEKKKEYRKNWVALTSRFIPYNPTLRKLTGSVTSAILMQQLEYWFSVMDGKPFYKYMTMPEGEYARGKRSSNWANELEFSEDEFRTAFDKIGIRYRSKKAYYQASDKFQGKMYLSYYEKTSHLTYYHRNQPLIESNLMTLEISTSKGNEQNQSDNPDNSNIDNIQENKTETNKENTSYTPSQMAGKREEDISPYKEINIIDKGYDDNYSFKNERKTQNTVVDGCPEALLVSVKGKLHKVEMYSENFKTENITNGEAQYSLDEPIDNAPLDIIHLLHRFFCNWSDKSPNNVRLTIARAKQLREMIRMFSPNELMVVTRKAFESEFYSGRDRERFAGAITFDELFKVPVIERIRDMD